MSKTTTTLWITAIGLALAFSACSESAQRREAEMSEQEARQPGTEAADDASRRAPGAPADSLPTAESQSETGSDVRITAQIRQAVMADNALSAQAKNVTIITRAGYVTLRGSVNDEPERTRIERAATGVPGVVHVDNRLEIKSTSGSNY
jgi:osmotically-inducible protein OsmY